MLSAIGQCVALVSYAQYTLDGHAEALDWKASPWFAYTADYRFGVGEDGGPVTAADPNGWFAALREQGFQRAALFVEPFDHTWDPIMKAGFAGGLRLAPVTTLPGGDEIVWHERARFDKDAKAWHVYRGGYRVMPGQTRVRATKAEAGAALDTALAAMVDFQQAHRPSEPQWSEMFEQGRRILQAARLASVTLPAGEFPQKVVDGVRSLFPARVDPDPHSLALVAAVSAAWALGGMGWWNDWDTNAEGFAEVTFPYYEALLAALTAACEPRTGSPA